MDINNLRATVSGKAGNWHGRLMLGSRAVWTCPHQHVNRDQRPTRGESAHSCAAIVRSLILDPDYESRMNDWALRAWRSNHDGSDLLASIAAMRPVAEQLKADLVGERR